MLPKAKVVITILILISCFYSGKSISEPDTTRYSQLVLTFPNERHYEYFYNEIQNSIVLQIKDTSSEELETLNNYDENLVRRVLVKDFSPNDTEIHLTLKDLNVRATINHFRQPFRIVVDLFDKRYRTQHDAKTGLPIQQQNQQSAENLPPTILGLGSTPSKLKSLPVQEQEEPYLQNSPTARSPSPNLGSGQPRKLLQPSPKLYNNPNKLALSLSKVPPGKGKGWKKYPIYITRSQLATYKTGKSYPDFLQKNSKTATKSANAMADYAGKLFDFGDEGRALLAYKQVIHKAPQIFNKHPLHLWRLAETHLGQANLSLADSYYQSMIEKHPDHPLSQYAKLRRLDIVAIRQTQKSSVNKFPQIASELEKINPYKDMELKAQLAIRRSYWNAPKKDQIALQKNRFKIPSVSPEINKLVEESYQNIELPRTGLLLNNIALEHQLSKTPLLRNASIKLADHYFKTYKGKKIAPFQNYLLGKITENLNSTLDSFLEKEDYLSVIKTYEMLSERLKKLKLTPYNQWALGEAYRNLGQPEAAIPFYKNASKYLDTKKGRFLAQFWLSSALTDTHESLSATNNRSAKTKSIKQDLKSANKLLWSMWKNLDRKDKNSLMVGLKSPIQNIIDSPTLSTAHPNIALSAWQSSLNPSASKAKDNPLSSVYTTNGSTVKDLKNLADKFTKLGLPNKRNQTLELLTKIKPSDFGGEKDIEDLWADQLTSLAETYRTANQYLDAGRIYSFTGKNSQNWEGRAEALYKGGLLLYRAGKRTEAIEAFTQASEDGNNLLYSELAKKRLDLLNQ